MMAVVLITDGLAASRGVQTCSADRAGRAGLSRGERFQRTSDERIQEIRPSVMRLRQLNQGFCIFNLIYGQGMLMERAEFSIEVFKWGINTSPVESSAAVTLVLCWTAGFGSSDQLGCAWY